MSTATAVEHTGQGPTAPIARSGPAVRLAGLFPQAIAVPLGRRGVLLAALVVATGAAVSLARTGGTGALQSIWEEDARDILNDALTMSGAKAVLRPLVGYFVIGPRLLGELATLFPLRWAAAVLSISSALITALLALLVYIASRAHVASRWVRVLFAAPMLAAPVAENNLSEIYNRPVGLHFFVMYALFWVLLWVPGSTAGRAVALVTVGLSAVSTILTLGFIPLALVRLYAKRDRLSAGLLGLLLGGAALNVAALYLGLTTRSNISTPKLDPVWALVRYVVWAVPNSVLGYRATMPLAHLPGDFGVAGRNLGVILLAWLVIGVAVAIAATRRLTRPAWLLAAVAAAHSVALMMMMVMAQGEIAQRYLLPVEMLLFVTLGALLLPVPGHARPWLAAAPLFGLTALIAVTTVFNYRWNDTYRSHAPQWSLQVERARQECRDPQQQTVIVRGAPQPWWSIVAIPCSELRDEKGPCLEPACTWLDGPPRALSKLDD